MAIPSFSPGDTFSFGETLMRLALSGDRVFGFSIFGYFRVSFLFGEIKLFAESPPFGTRIFCVDY